ncbi:MAG: retroviral-like aspartic protease family protein [Agarilytica sp.]
MKSVSLVSVLLLGFLLGWWGRDFYASKEPSYPPSYSPSGSERVTLSEDDRVVFKPRDDVEGLQAAPHVSLNTSSRIEVGVQKDALVAFQSLLEKIRFDEAIDLYQTVAEHDALLGSKLKSALMRSLKSYLTLADTQLFNELIQAYLNSFYDDIDVLLLLAEYHTNAEYYFEALDVYQLSQEYSYKAEDTEKVRNAFNDFLAKMDAHLSENKLVYLLAQIYQHADGISLLTSHQRLRLAKIYVENQEDYYALQLLHELAKVESVKSEAKRQLALLKSGEGDSNIDSPSGVVDSFDASVKLLRRGNHHYVVELQLGGGETVKLMIDTGASMTTISREVYDRIAYDVPNVHVGSRMFRTANGIASAQVKRVEFLSLGPYSIEKKNIAVMDFSMADGVDGLLGMNILNDFIFQIEPNAPVLLLSPR